MGGDARNWDEDGYRNSILQERELRSRTAFRTVFAPSQNPNPETIVVASSDGSIASYSLSTCISSSHPSQYCKIRNQQSLPSFLVAEPSSFIRGHDGPAYDLKFYGNGEDSLLLSCGDDGRIKGWRWKEIINTEMPVPMRGKHLEPFLDLVNPQHRGPWGALSPIPENNAIAIDDQEKSKIKMVFRGHSDYLHCIVTRKSSSQIITGSEDGTARIWDCRSGKCIQVIATEKGTELRRAFSCVNCIALDASESWLACGDGWHLSIWNLPAWECISKIATQFPPQDILFDDNQILAVGAAPTLNRFDINGKVLSQIHCAPQSAFSVSLHPSGVTAVAGYGGLVDVISQFGSHLCTFCCRGE